MAGQRTTNNQDEPSKKRKLEHDDDLSDASVQSKRPAVQNVKATSKFKNPFAKRPVFKTAPNASSSTQVATSADDTVMHPAPLGAIPPHPPQSWDSLLPKHLRYDSFQRPTEAEECHPADLAAPGTEIHQATNIFDTEKDLDPALVKYDASCTFQAKENGVQQAEHIFKLRSVLTYSRQPTVASRICRRTLSVFKPSKRLWAPISSSRCAPSQVTQRLAQPSRFSLVTQNLDAFSSRPVTRAKLLLDGILEESKRPDVIFLQEVTSDVHAAILANPKVREAFLVTDAQDQTSFEGVPFANMTLLSSKRFAFDLESREGEEEGGAVERGEKFVLGPVSRVKLPSKYGRCALSVDIIPPSTPSTPAAAYRLVNAHLDSLGDTLPYRTEQLDILANLLREPGCAGGLIAGDFNAISSDDHALLDKNELVDAWVALRGEQGPDEATWGVGVERDDGLTAGRLDKVAMLGVEAKDMEIMRPPLIEVPKPAEDSDYIPYSDHYGLRLSFITV